MSFSIFNKIAIDLPNFPEEIIQNWLLPIAKKNGWPPTEETMGGILKFQSIDYWKNIIWEKQSLKFSEIIFSPGYQKMIEEMIYNYENGKKSLPDSTERIDYFIDIIKKNEPLKPITLIFTKNGLDIADGNHRITACKSLIKRSIVNEIILDVWIGRPQTLEGAFYWSNR